jgi:hypothetical protein
MVVQTPGTWYAINNNDVTISNLQGGTDSTVTSWLTESFLVYVMDGLVEISANNLAIHCATSYLSIQMTEPQNIK